MWSSVSRERTRGVHAPPNEAHAIDNRNYRSSVGCPLGERQPELLRGKPFVVNLLIRAILAHGQERVVDLFAQRVARLEHDPVVLLAERQSDHVNTALAFIRRVIKQDWRIEHDSIGL